MRAVPAGGALAACVLLAAAGLWMTATGAGLAVRFARGGAAAPRGLARRRARPLLGPVTDRLSESSVALMSGSRRRQVRRRLDAAGRPGGMSVETYAGRRAASTVILGGAGLLVAVVSGRPAVAVASAAIGWFHLDMRLRYAARRRQARIDRDLPDLLDVLSVSVQAGLAFRPAIARAAEALGGPLAEEVATTLRAMEVGAGRRAAFDGLRERSPSPALRRFVGALQQAEGLGTPVADTMERIAGDMREEFRQAVRRRAARAAPRVSLIVTLIIVPGAVVLIMTALFLGVGVDAGSLSG